MSWSNVQAWGRGPPSRRRWHVLGRRPGRAGRSGRRTKNKAELPKAARGRNSANSVPLKFKSALLVHVAACEPNWATAIYAPLGQRTRGGDGESSNPSAKYYHYIHILGLPETFIY